MAHPAPFAAVVLAGGRAARLDGADKAMIEYHGRTLLAHALDAVADADEVVVVGDPVPTAPPVAFVRESPRYGGPGAALLAGCDALQQPAGLLVVLAVDMPRVTRQTVARLRDALLVDPSRDGVVLVGPDGRRQIALVLRTGPLDGTRPEPGQVPGIALHRLLSGLDLLEVPAFETEAHDVDNWADLRDP